MVHTYALTHVNIVSSPPDTGGTKNFTIFSPHSGPGLLGTPCITRTLIDNFTFDVIVT